MAGALATEPSFQAWVVLAHVWQNGLLPLDVSQMFSGKGLSAHEIYLGENQLGLPTSHKQTPETLAHSA